MARNFLSENQIHFGLDYLSIYGIFKYEYLFNSLNFENSNYWEIEDYVYVKRAAWEDYEYAIDFNYNNYKVFSYVKPKHNPKRVIHFNHLITIYWVAFTLLEIDEIDRFLYWYFDCSHVKRFDICCDMQVSIPRLEKRFKGLKQKWWVIYWKWWRVETIYYGNVKKSENKRSIIRMYDKLEDLKDSSKRKLYWEYFQNWKPVTRIELEIRREYAKNIHYRDLFNESILKGLFKNYLSRHTDIFSNITEEKITLYKKPKELTQEELQSNYYSHFLQTHFLAYAKKIYKLWACPVRILIWDWILQDKTKILLWRDIIEHLMSLELQLRRKIKSEKRRRQYDKKIEDIFSGSTDER